MDEYDLVESKARVNGVEIAYQLHGSPSQSTVMLIHGLGTPLSGWPQMLVDQFVAQGHQVLLFDNRDMGKSELLDKLPIPNMLWFMLKYKAGFGVRAPYQLEDMMSDTIGLLNELGLAKVHVVGASMGGMIAQLIALHHPQRVSSLCSIMSTTGTKKLPPMSDNVKNIIMQKPKSSNYEDRKEYHVNKWKAIGSPDYPSSEEYLNEYVDGTLKRGITAKGTTRQMLAIMTASDRTSALSQVNIPTLVIHGKSDELVNVYGGKATANAIPNAKLKIIEGMGHDFPLQLVPELALEIASHIRQSEGHESEH